MQIVQALIGQIDRKINNRYDEHLKQQWRETFTYNFARDN